MHPPVSQPIYMMNVCNVNAALALSTSADASDERAKEDCTMMGSALTHVLHLPFVSKTRVYTTNNRPFCAGRSEVDVLVLGRYTGLPARSM